MIPGLEILNLHAQGGMAEVYRARGKGSDGRTWMYAVKRILPEFTADPELRKMFVEEARIASNLIHPNVVRVYDLARSEGDEYFIVMEFLEGRDLAEAVDKCNELGRKLPVWLAIHCAREVLAALVYATTQARDKEGRLLGLIHRDISPHNIFVCFDGQVKLTDFGVAKVQQSAVLTQVGVTKGKFGYMSPEQLTSSGLDFRSDLYNVGILLYEVLTCRRLFYGDNPSQFLQAMIRGDVPALDPALGVPPELESLMRRALSRDRTDRPGTAAAFDTGLSIIQDRYGLHVTPAHVEAEWSALFAAEIAAPTPRARPASAPHRLASMSAALPEVVARAQVPVVRPPSQTGSRTAAKGGARPSSRVTARPPTRAPVPQLEPETGREREPYAASSSRGAQPAAAFGHEPTFDDVPLPQLEVSTDGLRPSAHAMMVEADRARARPRAARALAPEPDPATLPPINNLRTELAAELDPRTLPPEHPDSSDVSGDGPVRPRGVTQGAGANAVKISRDGGWAGEDARIKSNASRPDAPRPEASRNVTTRSPRVVPLPAMGPPGRKDDRKG